MFMYVFTGFFLFIFLRSLYLIFFGRSSKTKLNPKNKRVVIVMGSGGHTTEMLKLTEHLNPKLYRPRIYIMASSDKNTENKILSKEYSTREGEYKIVKIPRSREVNQSYISSVFTTLYSTLFSLPVMFYHRPNFILCNGPGTCIPICIIAFLMQVLFVSDSKIVFIESICRVKTLSLSGQILQYMADVALVQWPDLEKIYPRTRYIGRL